MSDALQVPERIFDHKLRLEGDILVAEFIGGLDLTMMKQLVPVYHACISHLGYMLLLMEVSRSTGVDADARRYVVEWAKDHASVQSTAVCGAPAIVRGFLTLLNRATSLLAKGTAPELTFVASISEGRSWLGEQRPKMQQAAELRRTRA